MPRLPGLDPEILADLRRREASEGDRSRSRETARAFDPSPVEHWPCRCGCGAMVPVPQAALDTLAIMNAALARRREAPLSKAKIALCDECRRRDEDLAAMQREAQRPRQQAEMQFDGPTKAAQELERRTNPNRRSRP